MCNLPVARYRGLVTYEKRSLTAGPCCRVSDTALLCCWFQMHNIPVIFPVFIASLLCNVRLLANLRVAVFSGVGVWNFNGSWFISFFLQSQNFTKTRFCLYIAYVFEVTLFEADFLHDLGLPQNTPSPNKWEF